MTDSQTAAIYKHLQHSPLTALEALARYGCMRTAARVRELREAGHIIHTEMIEKHGKRFAQYRLIEGETSE